MESTRRLNTPVASSAQASLYIRTLYRPVSSAGAVDAAARLSAASRTRTITRPPGPSSSRQHAPSRQRPGVGRRGRRRRADRIGAPRPGSPAPVLGKAPAAFQARRVRVARDGLDVDSVEQEYADAQFQPT